jgi:signal transduction histidine kinase
MNNIRILLVEDDYEDYLITKNLLRSIPGEQRYELDWISSYEEARDMLPAVNHDLCLIDYNLGIHNGFDLVKEVSEHCTRPFIFLTGCSDYETDQQAMLLGATDFLVKGSVTPGELERAIRYGIQHHKTLDEIRRLNASLEKRVEERTLDLARMVKELEQSNQTLQEAISQKEIAQQQAQESLEKEKMINELKSRFITLASHEFRTPLSTILSSVQLLTIHLAGIQEDKTEKHFKRIRSNVALLTDLLNDFLSLEKLEAGKISPAPEQFHFRELITETIQEIQDSAKPGQKIVHIAQAQEGPEVVMLDKRHVKGILINLLSNAVKYSGENAVITVTSSSTPMGQKVQVTDPGIGIPKDEQDHLFSSFFRARNAINIEGTGLGLSIVKKYLELMDGNISFESDPETGTTFCIALPNQLHSR